MLSERSKVPPEPKKRDFFPAKNPVDARREVVSHPRERTRNESPLEKKSPSHCKKKSLFFAQHTAGIEST